MNNNGIVTTSVFSLCLNLWLGFYQENWGWRGGGESLVAQLQGPRGWASRPIWMTHVDSRSSQCTEQDFTLPRPIPSCLPSLPVIRPKRPVHMACSEKQLSNPTSSPADPSSPLGSQSSSLPSVAFIPLVKSHRLPREKNSSEEANGLMLGSGLASKGAGRPQLRQDGDPRYSPDTTSNPPTPNKSSVKDSSAPLVSGRRQGPASPGLQ